MSAKPGWRRLTIKGNESCWDMLARVFDVAATHGGFDPNRLQAQFDSAVSEGTKNLQMLEDQAEREAQPSEGETEQKEPVQDLKAKTATAR